ncbi:MAG: hypothetical protein HOH58_16610 [Opitutaceae bacterium]|jgi:hypothetical protein|nr:hypothetical protein [Opitutaceae bacterium]
MKRTNFLFALVALVLFSGSASFVSADHHGEKKEFGPFQAVVFDKEIIQDVRVKGDDIFIKLQPDHRNDTLTMKNSMQAGGPYRKWFNGEVVFVAQENAGRAANTWTDRMQSSANYIDYYSDGKLFLRLKRK